MNKRSKRLVNGYIKKQAKEQKAFLVTDEFHRREHFKGPNFWSGGILNELESVQLITNLCVCRLTRSGIYGIARTVKKCKRVKKLSIHDKNYYSSM